MTSGREALKWEVMGVPGKACKDAAEGGGDHAESLRELVKVLHVCVQFERVYHNHQMFLRKQSFWKKLSYVMFPLKLFAQVSSIFKIQINWQAKNTKLTYGYLFDVYIQQCAVAAKTPMQF